MSLPRLSLGQTDMLRELRSNARLRLGLYVIGFILLFYLISLLGTARDQLHGRYVAVAQQHANDVRVAGQAYWPKRAEQAQSRLLKWQGLLWHADSPGLAQADLQSWMNGLASHLKLRNANITTQSAVSVANQSGIWMVSGTLQAKFDAAVLPRLLARIEKHQPRVQVVHLDARPGRLDRMRIGIEAYFTAAPGGSAGSASSRKTGRGARGGHGA